jgi:hypothetical protein
LPAPSIVVLLVSLTAGLVAASYAFGANGGSRTYLAAANIPSSDYYDGLHSVKLVPLTAALYTTMKETTGAPRLLAVACWSKADWPAVAGASEDGRSVLEGFWESSQPRWLHLSPHVCERIQRVINGEPLTGARAYGLVTAIHETLHAYGVKNEAQANCYAVQITPRLARKLGVVLSRIGDLGRLARNFTRRTAPAGYWNAFNCRDGGSWDLYPGLKNLS